MLSRSKVALQNCNSSELVLIIFTPDDSLLALGDHVQQLKETHSSMGLPRLPPCVMSPWKMCSRLTGRTLRRCTACHVLEHNFKYMDAVNAVLYTRYMGEYLSYDAGQGVQLMDGGGDQYVRHWERLSGLGELGEILADLKGRTFHRWHIRFLTSIVVKRGLKTHILL